VRFSVPGHVAHSQWNHDAASGDVNDLFRPTAERLWTRMKQSIILGIGTGRCGTASLAKVLNRQAEANCSYEEPPLLPWRPADSAERVIRERFARFRNVGKARLLGDVASFYLP
jgi:hypothetical protein